MHKGENGFTQYLQVHSIDLILIVLTLLGVFEKLYVAFDLLLVISEPLPFTFLIYLKLLEPYAQVLLKNIFIVISLLSL